jgi:hypothetical protein
LTQAIIDREYELDIPNKSTGFLTAGISYVSDKVIWESSDRCMGNAIKSRRKKSFKTSSDGYSYTSYELDYRKYIHFASEYHFAIRSPPECQKETAPEITILEALLIG